MYQLKYPNEYHESLEEVPDERRQQVIDSRREAHSVIQRSHSQPEEDLNTEQQTPIPLKDPVTEEKSAQPNHAAADNPSSPDIPDSPDNPVSAQSEAGPEVSGDSSEKEQKEA